MINKDKYQVIISYGNVERVFCDGTEKECIEICELYKWEFSDENDFVWDMSVIERY